jgi:hypothetical protein
MQEMMDLQLAKQHREEMLREAESNHKAKALRAARKQRAGGRAAPVWEIKRHAGRLLKLLGTLRIAG